MATQMQLAREGKVTDAMRHVAEEEHVAVETVRERVAKGTIAICANVNHLAQGNFQPRGVGEGLRTKINANIGTSSTFPEIAPELEKLDEAVKCGADAVMDLSTGNHIDESRQKIIAHSPVMVGTVPLYQATVRSIREHGAVVEMTDDDILETIEAHAKDGADFMTLHCGVTRAAIEAMRAQGRVMDIVSRGGSFIAGWMLHNEQENPLYEHFDDILDICEKYDVTISLGDGMRPGCTSDATDRAQLTELITLGSLVDRAWRRGVQVMVEGPGHVPFDQIKANMQLEKRLCRNAPFYVLGPLVTDIAPGYDHITSAIGGTLAAASGADFLCYVTPAEHLALPTIEDVHTGVITARIAAHAADLVKNVPGVREWDRKMAEARKQLDWKAQMDLAIDPELARQKRGARNPEDEKACSMCGDYCAVEIIHKYFDKRECPFDD
ncbi:phosphomethylpyrimidine synthase ThiC [uncultured Selenomonas sp.]|uniref:phosphomethylpyrimidine synthase ThiC n=1 Tax=uncultured Selenomonas sp. TaxID=159275 RepID=UPI0025DBAC86|nr:phosphomethylpyrimidine synthase ThiC [uncultured Selenomonas sp.]